MSSSSEAQLIEEQDQTTILINDTPYRGKKINKYVFSPNMKYIATWSEDDKSIVGWTVSEELIIEPDHSIDTDLLKNILNTDKLENILRYAKIEFSGLIGVSNFKHIALFLNERNGPYNFEIIDITTKSRQILRAQGLKGKIDHSQNITFLENDDLVIIKGEPVYRAYIFSRSNKQWKCKDSIELKKYSQAIIFKDGKLLLLFDIPFIIRQWNLITRKFETQYILNWNLKKKRGLLNIEFNSDKTLLAVSSPQERNKQKFCLVYVYSTESGLMIASRKFNESSIHNFRFIGSREEERLFFSGPQYDTKTYNSYILNPLTHILDKPPDSHVLRDIYPVNYDTYAESLMINPYGSPYSIVLNIISDYIITIDNNNLSIQRLSQNENWINYLKLKEAYMGDTFYNVKEIKQFIKTTLDKCKSNQILIQNYSNESKEYSCASCTWIIETKVQNLEKDEYYASVKARLDTDEETAEEGIFYFEDKDGYILEIKVFDNGDILLVFSTKDLSGIQIWTLDSEKKSIIFIYSWYDGSKPEKVEAESIIKLLTFFNDKLGDMKNLPPPAFDKLTFESFGYIPWRTEDVLINGMNNVSMLKLYAKDMIYELIRRKDDEHILELLDNCLTHSLSILRNGEIYNFVMLIDQITSTLVRLENYNENLRATERFLSKINLLAPDNYEMAIDSSSLSYHLKFCGNYNVHELFSTSLFDKLIFWIFEKRSILKNSYPQIYKILAFPFFFYSYYFTTHPQKTIKLIIPLSNFAVYSKDYFFFEIFDLQDNSFTLLEAPDYYRYWNIKALIYFKWNTYGRQYYIIIWIIYSIFMCSFLIVSTIAEDISWNNTKILLLATIIFGLLHFTFEIRHFIHRPMSYISSPWNWFDLAAILLPTITSFIWLLYEIPPIWILSTAAFLLEIKFLLFFRVLAYFGTYFAIMIGVAQKIFSFLIILAILILAFAHSFHLLLRPTTKYSYNQPISTNDSNNPWNLVTTYDIVSSNGTVEGSSVIETPSNNINLFSTFGTSILAVYFMLTGDTAAVSSWGEILSEIELFWMLPYQRRKTNWFPNILYYEASVNELKKYVKKLKATENENEYPLYLAPAILAIVQYEDFEIDQSLKNQINKTIKSQIDETLKDQMDVLKNSIDKINKIYESIENKLSS
ncbi:transient receptor potential cation channel subfamily a member 1 isoform x2 [Gigaspora margarita]|uniref:Transient receptor potential cation channel subfamily a member 1 isoform x2 n=1 Tax=Gigaspora margarita TaxID=4874 RepID=A0A8H3X060_GIGMA|nr:transient receptor potential cation channel subfamily a member 1 isoform x2 [Gigaspora margarita]